MDSSSRYFLRHSGLNGLESQSVLRFCLTLTKHLMEVRNLSHAGNRRGHCCNRLRVESTTPAAPETLWVKYQDAPRGYITSF